MRPKTTPALPRPCGLVLRTAGEHKQAPGHTSLIYSIKRKSSRELLMPVLSLQALHPLRRRKLEEVSPLHQTQRLRAQSGVSHSHTICQITELSCVVCIPENLHPCLRHAGTLKAVCWSPWLTGPSPYSTDLRVSFSSVSQTFRSCSQEVLISPPFSSH